MSDQSLAELDDFNPLNPKSLINIVSPHWSEAARCIPLSLLELTNEELEARLFLNNNIDHTFFRLRLSFWDEYDRAQRLGEKMMMGNVCHGIVTSTAIGRLLKNHLFLAWLFHPPPGYTLLIKEIHQLSLKRQLEVMKIEIDPKKPNSKLIEAQLKIFQHLDNRIKGSIAQKIENKNLNVNVEASAPLPQPARLTLSDIELQIQMLRNESKLLEQPAHVKFDTQKLITGEIIDVDAGETRKTVNITTTEEKDKLQSQGNGTPG